MNNKDLVCLYCHKDDTEITHDKKYGFIVLCHECGFEREASHQHLLAC